MKKIGIFVCVALLISSCVTHPPQGSIRVYDENAYVVAKHLLRYDLRKQGIGAEILPSLNISNPFENVFGQRLAKDLYDKLSLSFRFPDSGFQLESVFLKDYISSDAVITMYLYGFTIDQGQEFITATILGVTDWDRDNVNDYLISFRINQKALNYELNDQQSRVELPTREYLLLIKDIDSSIYEAHVLFIHDYIKQSSGVRSEVYRNQKDAQNSLFQDHGAISFEQGQEQIVFAPNIDEKQKIESIPKEGKGTSLSE